MEKNEDSILTSQITTEKHEPDIRKVPADVSEEVIGRDILGAPMSEKAVLDLIHADPLTNQAFHALGNEGFRNDIVEFLMGQKGAKVCYDPVFKHIFNPAIHPERLSAFLSSLMGETVLVQEVLPTMSSPLSQEGSLLIMDILVKLKSGDLANVEIQRFGYAFPGQRGACYSSDLVMRQYSHVKSIKKKNFVYQDLKQVYTIVILERSTSEFHKLPQFYIHRSKQTFDSGLELDLLQKFIFISLDIFRKNVHNISKELDAWLLFLSSDDPHVIGQIVAAFPEFQELYDDLSKFRTNPKELIQMYSEALRILDYNTVQYMIEEKQKELEEKNLAIAEKDSAIAEKDSAIAEKDSAIAEKDLAIAKIQTEKDREIELLKLQLQRFQKE